MWLFLSVTIRCFDRTLLVYCSVIFAWSFSLQRSFSHLNFCCFVSSSAVASLDFGEGQLLRCFGEELINQDNHAVAAILVDGEDWNMPVSGSGRRLGRGECWARQRAKRNSFLDMTCHTKTIALLQHIYMLYAWLPS
jgi:hypothetical protein